MTNPGYPAVPGFTAYNDDSYIYFNLLATQTNTAGSTVSFWGALTPGDVLGFDYSFTHGGTPYNRAYRHTVISGDTHKSVIDDLAAQFKSDTVVEMAIGADVVSYALVRPAGPANFYFQFFQVWPMVTTANVTIYLSPGTTTQGQAANGSQALEVNPYIAFGRTTIAAGRQPQAGDNIWGAYICGDATGQAVDLRNVDPFYGQLQAYIIDPTPGVTKGKFSLQFDTLDLQVTHFLVNGQPAGPVGVQGPPGGNIAGSIVQSPDLQITADVAQPDTNFTSTKVFNLKGLSIIGWTTIATITPSNVSGSYGISKFRVEGITSTHGMGNGYIDADIYIQIAGSAPTCGYLCLPLKNWGSGPQIRTVTTGNAVEVQIASPNGVNYIASGLIKLECMLSDAEGNPVTWTIQ